MSNQQTNEQANVNATDYGQQAVSKWASRDKSGAQGDALGLVAIVLAFETMSFTASWTEKEDGKQRTHRIDFDLKEYMTKTPMNANGTRNNKATKARTDAVMQKVFGVTNATSAQLQSLRRCVEMAKNFIAKGFTSDDLAISKRGYLEVPYALMHDQPDPEKASEREIKAYNKAIANNDTEILDGTEGMSVSKFAQRIAPKRQATVTSNEDNAKSFVASVKFAQAVVAEWNKEDGEPTIAPSDELRTLMHELQVQLTTYFKADPVETKTQRRKAA